MKLSIILLFIVLYIWSCLSGFLLVLFGLRFRSILFAFVLVFSIWIIVFVVLYCIVLHCIVIHCIVLYIWFGVV